MSTETSRSDAACSGSRHVFAAALVALMVLGGGGKAGYATDVSAAPFRFVDVSEHLGPPREPALHRAYGLAAGDLDGDGRVDLLLMNHGKRPSVLLNRGSDGFVDVQPASGLTMRNSYPGQNDRHGASLGDYDNDGWLDLMVTHGGARGETLGKKFDQLLRNVGARFEIVSMQVGLLNRAGRGRTARFVDFDRDGRLDVHIGNFESDNVLYRATVDGMFEDVTAAAGLPPSNGWRQSWTDLDDDGWPDLMTSPPPRFWRNRGDSTFEPVELPPRLAKLRGVMGTQWGDYDSDGDDDLFTASLRPGRSRLWENREGRLGPSVAPFVPREAIHGAAWADLDADGDLDLVVVTVDATQAYENLEGRLLEEPHPVVGPGTGDPGAGDPVPAANGAVAPLDFDGDGRLDLAVNLPRVALLMRNESSSGAWLALRLIGRSSNRSALGSRVEVSSGDLTAFRFYDGSPGGTVSKGAAPLFIGLGDRGRADVAVRWPSGIEQALRDLPVNRSLVLVEPELGTASRAQP